MPFLVQVGAQVMCAHGGQVQPTVPFPRVMAGGQPVVQMPNPWMVAGCAFPPPPAGNGPCLTAMFMSGTTRVMAGGMPLLTQASQATCVPTGTPAMVVMTQLRVQAT
jgi:hypothetical protein